MKNKMVPMGTKGGGGPYPVITAQLVRAQLSHIFNSGVVGGGGGSTGQIRLTWFPVVSVGRW